MQCRAIFLKSIGKSGTKQTSTSTTKYYIKNRERTCAGIFFYLIIGRIKIMDAIGSFNFNLIIGLFC